MQRRHSLKTCFTHYYINQLIGRAVGHIFWKISQHSLNQRGIGVADYAHLNTPPPRSLDFQTFLRPIWAFLLRIFRTCLKANKTGKNFSRAYLLRPIDASHRAQFENRIENFQLSSTQSAFKHYFYIKKKFWKLFVLVIFLTNGSSTEKKKCFTKFLPIRNGS